MGDIVVNPNPCVEVAPLYVLRNTLSYLAGAARVLEIAQKEPNAWVVASRLTGTAKHGLAAGIKEVKNALRGPVPEL